MPDWLWYPLPFIPFIPFITRGILSLRFRPKMSETLAEDENDRESHRTLILALAAFSFAALLAIAVLDTTTQRFRLPTYYLLISFLSYYFALNLQGYKFARWHDQLGDALVEAASLSLILAVMAVRDQLPKGGQVPHVREGEAALGSIQPGQLREYVTGDHHGSG